MADGDSGGAASAGGSQEGGIGAGQGAHGVDVEEAAPLSPAERAEDTSDSDQVLPYSFDSFEKSVQAS